MNLRYWLVKEEACHWASKYQKEISIIYTTGKHVLMPSEREEKYFRDNSGKVIKRVGPKTLSPLQVIGLILLVVAMLTCVNK